VNQAPASFWICLLGQPSPSQLLDPAIVRQSLRGNRSGNKIGRTSSLLVGRHSTCFFNQRKENYEDFNEHAAAVENRRAKHDLKTVKLITTTVAINYCPRTIRSFSFYFMTARPYYK
jgi:hypothetical protein